MAMTENKRGALERVKEGLDFQVAVCEATSTSQCMMPLAHAIFLCHLIEDLLENGGKL